jgi:tetratricopeptide (TPR) repeat protein
MACKLKAALPSTPPAVRLSLYELGIQKLNLALTLSAAGSEISSSGYMAYDNLGLLLYNYAMELSRQGRPSDLVDSRFADAQEAFRLAAEKYPEEVSGSSHMNAALALAAEASLLPHTHPRRVALLQRSCDICRAALALPRVHKSYAAPILSNLSRSLQLLSQAETEVTRKQALLHEAVAVCREAQKRDPAFWKAAVNLSYLLEELGELEQTVARRRGFLVEARDALLAAVAVFPQAPIAWSQLHDILLSMADLTPPEEQPALQEEVITVARQWAAVSPASDSRAHFQLSRDIIGGALQPGPSKEKTTDLLQSGEEALLNACRHRLRYLHSTGQTSSEDVRAAEAATSPVRLLPLLAGDTEGLASVLEGASNLTADDGRQLRYVAGGCIRELERLSGSLLPADADIRSRLNALRLLANLCACEQNRPEIGASSLVRPLRVLLQHLLGPATIAKVRAQPAWAAELNALLRVFANLAYEPALRPVLASATAESAPLQCLLVGCGVPSLTFLSVHCLCSLAYCPQLALELVQPACTSLLGRALLQLAADQKQIQKLVELMNLLAAADHAALVTALVQAAVLLPPDAAPGLPPPGLGDGLRMLAFLADELQGFLHGGGLEPIRVAADPARGAPVAAQYWAANACRKLVSSVLDAPGFSCDGCTESIVGERYRCLVCDNFDLCRACHDKPFLSDTHLRDHVLRRFPVAVSIPPLLQQLQTELLPALTQLAASSHDQVAEIAQQVIDALSEPQL